MLNGFSAAEATGAMPRVTAKAEPTATEMIDFLLDMMVLLDVLMDTKLHLTLPENPVFLLQTHAKPTAIETKQNLYTAYSLPNNKNWLHSMSLSQHAALLYTREGYYL
jgi:hypothetical protein